MMQHPCQCQDGRWEEYDDTRIEYADAWPNPPSVVYQYLICMSCNASWRQRWFIGAAETELDIDQVELE